MKEDNVNNKEKGVEVKKAFIDASNVIRRTEDIREGGEPRLENLKLAIEEVEERGYESEPIGDASLWYVFGELGDLPLGLVDELNSASIMIEKRLPPDFKEAALSLREMNEKAQDIKNAVRQHTRADVDADVTSTERAIIWADPEDMSRVIGRNGRNVKKLKDEFNLKIEVKEASERPSKDSFKPGEQAFDEVKRVVEGNELKLSENAKIYAWRKREGGERWIILDGKREFEVSRWKDRSQEGKMRLSIHDRMDEEYLNLQEMLRCGDLRVEPTRREADEYILGFAEKFPDSVIISNDRYREYEDKYPFVRDRERHLNFDIVDNKILIAGLEDAEAPTMGRAPLETKEPQLKAPPGTREGEIQVEGKVATRDRGEVGPRVEKGKTRVLKAIGTTLACLGLLGLVFLPPRGSSE